MFDVLLILLDKGGTGLVLVALCVGFYFLNLKVKELCRRVERLENTVQRLLEVLKFEDHRVLPL